LLLIWVFCFVLLSGELHVHIFSAFTVVKRPHRSEGGAYPISEGMETSNQYMSAAAPKTTTTVSTNLAIAASRHRSEL
jgi:hypothetical protein